MLCDAICLVHRKHLIVHYTNITNVSAGRHIKTIEPMLDQDGLSRHDASTDLTITYL